jgi:RHS repeat-associated protein
MIKIIQAHEHAPVPYDLKKTNYVRMKTRILITAICLFSLMELKSQTTTPFPNNINGGSSAGIVGKIADEFDVSPSGQVSYEIPVSVVSGTGGIVPQVSIVYNGSLKEGLLGSGFDLSGLSMINRAPSNLHTDGKAGYVNLTSSDKFMLDGQRLIYLRTVNSSTYEYRTENNSFSKIIANGSDIANPSSFTVYTKSGLIYEYSSNTSTLRSSTATNIIFWLLRKVSDTKGNYFTISYDRDDVNGEFWPVRMDYTGNNSASPVLVPYASIRFDYTSNSYPSDSYIYGVKVRKSKLVNKISIYFGETCVKYYQMAYQTVNNKMQLNSVTEYASDGSKVNPTKFSWYNSSGFVTTNVDYNTSTYINKANLTVGDFNGDGKADFFVTPQNSSAGWTGWRVFLSNGSTFSYIGSGALQLAGEIQEVVSGDFNGDGNSDIVIKRKYNNTYYNSDLYLSNGSGGFTFSKCFISDTKDYSIRAVEVNGDGVSDIFLWYKNDKNCKIVYSEYNGTTVLPLNYTATRSCTVNWDRVEFCDFNGDGLTDVMNLHSSGYYLLESDGCGTMSQTRSETFPNKDHHLYFGDFNGDGKTDMLLTGWNKDPNSGGWPTWNIQFSKGDGTFERVDFAPKFNSKNKVIYVADINGDGKDDFYAVDKTTGTGTSQVYAYLNDGTGRYFQQISGASTYGLDKWRYYTGDFNGDGKTDFLCTGNYSTAPWTGCQLFLVPPQVNNLLATITDGLGNVTEISYKSMCDNTIHERGTTKTYPLTSFCGNWYLVDKVTTPNGLGGKNMTSYKYKNALIHKRGRGILGFEYFTSKDEVNNIETKTQYEVNTTQYVTNIKSITITASGKLVNSITNTNKLLYQETATLYNKVFTFVTSSTVESKYEYNSGSLISSDETSMEYDGYGNITKSTAKNGTRVITNTNTYTNDETKWLLGRLTQATVTKVNGAESVTRTSKFQYNATTGLLEVELVEPDDAKMGFKKTYTHDAFGNILQNTTTPNNTLYAARTEKSKYDAKGRFEIEATNSLNFVSKNEMDTVLCVVKNTVDPNNIKTDFSYDKFGQLLITKTPLGYLQKVNRWSAGNADAPSNAVYFTYTESTGNPTETDFYDCLGRTIRKVTQGLNGEKIYVDIVYNTKGQVEKTSEPYFPGQTVYWNLNEYDAVGRVTKQTYADNSFYTFLYSGLTTTTTDPLGQKDIRKLDVFGNLIESTDNKNGSVKYNYNVSGNCITTTAPRTIIKTEYDKLGNRTKLIDPDLGTVVYEYNAYGELVTQTDGSGVATFKYDNAGRLLTETRKDVTVTNVYDTKWKGAISQSSASNNISQVYGYDTYGRVISVTENIKSNAFVTSTTYNAINKIDIITYPTGFKIQNGYSTTGYLSKVSNPVNGKVYWQANTMNARGQLEKITLGNNLSTTTSYNPQKGYITGMVTPGIQNWAYTFNTVGNLTDRKDNLKNLTEHFDYDELNRLWKVSQNGTLKQEILYDAAGNITSKTGVGTSFVYQNGTNRLLSVSGSGYNPLVWDSIQYTSFNKISYIKQGNSYCSIEYGVNKERKYFTGLINGVTKSKFYVGNLYEREINNNEKCDINYIFANGAIIAIDQTTTTATTTVKTFRYLHKDHLGSIQAYSDESGKLIQELSYDSWGRRRNPANWTYYPALTNANAWNPRGFTGHEHLDAFEMINMDGRMYDPVLGRFMSPDPTVQAADYTQGLNRYSYCLNNPLSLIDPSGYSWFSRNWKCLAASAVGIVVTVVSAGIGSGVAGVMIAGALGGAAAGLSGALLNGADFGQIVKATFTGGFWGAASGFLAYGSGGGQFLERLFKHSFSQAWMEGIKGGDMKHGFLVGLASASGGTAITKYCDDIGKVGKIAANAILAGTVSEIGGGKFANGAVTGAFSMLFNDLMHGNSNLKSYVKKMFPGRLPKGVTVTFDLYDGKDGNTVGDVLSPSAPVSVKIPKSLWKLRNGDNALLFDCIDHELVHVKDYANGNAFRLFDAYDLGKMEIVMEYNAYSENLWYNENRRENSIYIDYYKTEVEKYREKLPKNWLNYYK